MNAADGGASILTTSQRALLRAVQDRLVPRDGDLSGAGELGCAERVDGYLVERPELRPTILAALQAIEVAAPEFAALPPEQQDAALEAVEAAHPVHFRILVRQTYTAYYTHPTVQAALGTVPPQPAGYTLTPLDAARLDPVRRRDKLWRDA